jgi:hypothetical protein
MKESHLQIQRLEKENKRLQTQIQANVSASEADSQQKWEALEAKVARFESENKQRMKELLESQNEFQKLEAHAQFQKQVLFI